MHSVLFHVSPSQRLYEITNLGIKDILSICNPLVQLRITYDLRELTAKPVTEADVKFTWEQVSGSTVLDINATDSAEPYILLDGVIVDDVVFRLYIDKGSKFEQSLTMTIYRTPTASASSNQFSLTSTSPNQPLAVGGVSRTNTAPVRQLRPTKVTVVPKLDVLAGSTVYTELTLPQYSAVVDYPVEYVRAGHRVIGLQAFHPITGVLIASGTHDTIINLPLSTTVFYLNVIVELNYYNNLIQTETVNINSNNVYSTYFKQFARDQNFKTLYITEGVSTNQNILLPTESETDVTLVTSLPVIKNIIAESTTASITLAKLVLTDVTQVKFKAAGLLVEEVSSVVTLVAVNKTQESNKVLTRFNGISIGG